MEPNRNYTQNITQKKECNGKALKQRKCLNQIMNKMGTIECLALQGPSLNTLEFYINYHKAASTDLVISALQRDYHQILGLLLSNRLYTLDGVH